VVVTDQASGGTYVNADAVMFTPVSGLNRAEWVPTLPQADSYKVYAWWRSYPDRATNAHYRITHDGGASTVIVNQQANGGKWNYLGTFPMTPGQSHVSLTDEGNGYVIADAVQITSVNAPPPTATWVPPLTLRDQYQVYTRWAGYPDRATNAPYTIFYEGGSTTVLMNQQATGSSWRLLGTFTMAPGQNHRVELADTANGYLIADALRVVPVAASKTATWTLTPAQTASYRVYAKWPASSANATDAHYTVSYEGGSSTVTVNQRVSGGQWVLLGTFPFNASGSGYKVDLADTSASGKVVADAIYYVQDGAPVDSFTWTPDIQSAGDYQLYARWTASSANSGAAQYTVVHGGGTSLVTVNQKQNGGQWSLLGTWSFAPGAGHQVTLTASSDGNVVADAIKLVGTGPAPANLVYLHTDQIGLPQKITDATGALVWDRVQDPFGRQVSLTNSGIDTALRFPGQQADPDTGFAYNYYRDYDPTLGRYIQADPIGLAGGINRYAYVSGNPVRFSDRRGLDSAESSRRNLYYPGPFDILIPGTPANDLWTKWVSRELRQLWDELDRVGTLSMSGDAEDIRASAQSAPDVCTTGDPNDFCFERWEREDARCSHWVGLGVRWVKACRERAAIRRDLCIRNGGESNDEPPEWSPFLDYPR
jgi:RHS repeat-associated protein